MAGKTYSPGDILLVNDFSGPTDWLGGLIRDGERVRCDSDDLWTHSAIIVSTDGKIVEAMQQGVMLGHVREYAHRQTKIISLPVPPKDPRRAYAARYALGLEGEAYGVVDFISLGVSLLFRNSWSTHMDHKPICSELVARATESVTDHGYPYASERMMPGDIDRYFDGAPPLPTLGFWRRLGLLVSVTVKAALGKL